MIQFTSRLKKEVDEEIEQIEHSEISSMTKSLIARVGRNQEVKK